MYIVYKFCNICSNKPRDYEGRNCNFCNDNQKLVFRAQYIIKCWADLDQILKLVINGLQMINLTFVLRSSRDVAMVTN